MIKLRKKQTSVAPDILLTKGKAATNAHITKFNAADNNFSFDKSIYGHKEVKKRLLELQDHKCCFCESKISHIAYGDVEHFRPKGGWVQDDEPINTPGYYWLAYDWENLLLSCEICNERYKKNFFPLADASKRALIHSDNINGEDPLFIHPATDEPEDHITFNEDVPKPKNGSLMGSVTITQLGLAREQLNEQRRSKLEIIADLYNLAKNYPPAYPEAREDAKNAITKYYNKSKEDSTEYASMLRSFFKSNPIDF